MIIQGKSRVKPSGSRLKPLRHKKLFEKGSSATLTKLGETARKTERIVGGATKFRMLRANVANLLDPATKKFEKSKIITIKECKANRHYVRRNIMTKGTVILTDKGEARITNKPGQEGVINAILLAKKA